MKVLIIGGSGQDAFYLAQFLSKNNVKIVWVYRNSIDRYFPFLHTENISLCKVDKYDMSSMMHLFVENKFSSCALIVGAVGNQYARKYPSDVYSTNILLANTIAILIQQYSPETHLYYFSSVDVMGSSSKEGPILFSPERLSRTTDTTYGLSKLHASEYLEALNVQGLISCTVLYLGMHESFLRTGNYVLTKIKDIVYSLHETSQPKPATFGNLDVELDIGFARDYMSIVGQLILQKISPKFVVIGTGVYTNLYDLCASVLHQFGLCADKFVISDRLAGKVYYPLVRFSHAGLSAKSSLKSSTEPLYVSPSPLDGSMLKYEYSLFN